MTPDSFFGTSLRRNPDQPAALNDRIEAQLRERLEEGVDFVWLGALVGRRRARAREAAGECVCLGALVERRRALGLPAPRADSASDRAEFTQSVRAFLGELQAAIAPGLAEGQRRQGG